MKQNEKENGESGRRVTEVTVDELLQLEQLKIDQIGKQPEDVPKATEELEVVVKVTDNLSVNLKCNADVTPVELLTRLVTEIRELTSQINSTNLQAKLIPQEDNTTDSTQQADELSSALNQITTVKELLINKQVPTLKLELSPRPTNTNGTSDTTSKDLVRGSDASGDRGLPASPRLLTSEGQGLTPRKKDLTPRPVEERPSLVTYVNTLLKLNDRASISPEDKKNVAKKYKRPKRDKKSNTSSANTKKTSRTMRSSTYIRALLAV